MSSKIPHYQDAYEKGGAIVSVSIGDGVDRAKVEDVLHKYGGSNVQNFGYAA